jgi:glycerol kinase
VLERIPACSITAIGITNRRETAAHLVRAALEAICFQTKNVTLAMEKDSGIKIRQLKVDGGASKKEFLCQFQADILGIDVIRPKITEITSLGAAYLAGLAIGYWNGPEAKKKCWRPGRTFHPGMSKRTVDGLYKGWTSALKRTLSRNQTGN